MQSRLQGIVKGTQGGMVQLQYVMADNSLQPGEPIVTSGGDRIFPKGIPIGTVREVNGSNREGFLNVRVAPAADLSRLEEVLVITRIVEKQNDANELGGPIRASDILAQRLPSVPQKPAEEAAPGANKPEQGAGTNTPPSGTAAKSPVTKAPASNTTEKKPGSTTTKPATSATTSPAGSTPARSSETGKPTTNKPATAPPPQAN